MGRGGKDQGGLEKDMGEFGAVRRGLGAKQQRRREHSWEAQCLGRSWLSSLARTRSCIPSISNYFMLSSHPGDPHLLSCVA